MSSRMSVAITCLLIVHAASSVITDIWPNIDCGTYTESPEIANRVCAFIEGGTVYLNENVDCAAGEVCSIVDIYDWLYNHVTNSTSTTSTLECSSEHAVDLDSIEEDDKTDCTTDRNYQHIFASQNLTEEEHADLDFDELESDLDFNADGLKSCITDSDCGLLDSNNTSSSCSCAMSGESYCYPMEGSTYMKDQYRECKDRDGDMDSYKYIYFLYKRAYGVFREGRPSCADKVVEEFRILNEMDKWDFGLWLLPAVVLLVN